MEPPSAEREFEEAVTEMRSELEKLAHNIQDVTQYQAQVFQIAKVLCSWMDNIKVLAKHRTQMAPDPAELP